MIRFTIADKEYTLEWTRQTIMWAEKNGLILEKLTDKPFSFMFYLFKGMLRKQHPEIADNEEKVSELIDQFQDEGYEMTDFLEESLSQLEAFTKTIQPNSKAKKKKLVIETKA